LKHFIKYHLLPFILAFVLAFIFVLIYINFKPNKSEITKDNTVKYFKKNCSTYSESPLLNQNFEKELVASLQDKECILLYGSSELSSASSSIPFKYLSEKKGWKVSAFGHAFQQNFSFFCQLLAMKKYLKNAKICFIISPGWFETEGTNIEAFLEFVSPNFLKRIINDNSISKNEKLYIGKYISKNLNLISSPSKEIKYFSNVYQYRNFPFLNDYFYSKTQEIGNVNYQIENKCKTALVSHFIDWEKEIKSLSNAFKSSVKTNKLYIEDNYFKNEVLRKDGTIRKGNFDQLNVKNNQELEDFRMLLQLLKSQKVNASFIIQGLNPFHYQNLDNFNSVLNELLIEINSKGFKVLNQFSSDTEKYQAGLLNDIMHTGDLGWLLMNKFLIEMYEQK
jgi:D-alanine transfer protein